MQVSFSLAVHLSVGFGGMGGMGGRGGQGGGTALLHAVIQGFGILPQSSSAVF